MTDVFSSYERGLEELLKRMDKDHPRYGETLTLQNRLLENIAQVRRYGDDETCRAERARILGQLEIVSRDSTGISFRELCDKATSQAQAGHTGFIQTLRWRETVVSLRIIAARLVRPAATLTVGVGALATLFGFVVFPTSKVVEWFPVQPTQYTAYAEESQAERPVLVLRGGPGQETYAQTALLSADAYPTAIGVHFREGKYVYVGTYGLGLYVSDGFSGKWSSLGLENLIVTEILADPVKPGSVIASTNLGVLSTQDNDHMWENKGPVNDLITALARDPTDLETLLAGTTHGVYRSEDKGDTWVGPSLEDESVASIAFAPSDPNRVYLGCLFGAVYRSDNGGSTWHLIRRSDNEGSAPIAVDPESPDTVYAGPADSGIYRSVDGGASWHYLGLHGASVSAILVSSAPDTAIFVGTDNEQGMFVSWDSGKTWENSGVLRDSVIDMIEDPGNPGTIMVTTPRNGLLETRDGGRNWKELGLQRPSLELVFPITHLAVVPGESDHLFGIPGFETGLFESTNGGASWSPIAGMTDLMGAQVARVVVHPYDHKQLFASALGGLVFHSEDGGQSWHSITANLPRGGYAPVAISRDGTLFAGASNRGVWVKARDSDEWAVVGLGISSIVELWVDPSGEQIYAFDQAGVLHISLDRGATWFNVPVSFYTVAVDLHETGSLVGISDVAGIMVSVDSGQTWEVVDRLDPGCTDFSTKVVADMKQPGIYYLVSGLVGKRSFDFGRTWQDFTLPESGVPYSAGGGRLYLSGFEDLYVSTDHGDKWELVRHATIISEFTGFGQLDPYTVLAGTMYDGLFVSRDSGETWKQTSIGAGNQVVELWVNHAADPSQAIALVESSTEVCLAVTTNARVWNPVPVPCETRGHYFESVYDTEGPVWQLECQDPRGLLILKPAVGLEWIPVELPQGSGYLVDSIYLPDSTTYLITSPGWPQNDRIWVSFDQGSTWRIAGYVPRSTGWALSNDTRVDSVLVARLEGGVVTSLTPKPVIPLVVYLTLASYVVFWGILVLWSSARVELLCDLRKVGGQILFSASEGVGGDISSIFVWLVCPVMLLSSVLVFQTLPLESPLNAGSYVMGDSSLVSAGGKLFERLPVRVIKPSTEPFLLLIVILLASFFLMSLFMAFSAGLLGSKGMSSLWRSAWKASLAVFAVGMLTFVVLGSVVTSAFILGITDASRFFPLSRRLTVEETASQAVMWGFYLFIIFIGYKAVAVSLNIVSRRSGVSSTRLATVYLVLTLVLSAAVGLLAFTCGTRLPVRLQPIVMDLPFIPFALGNFLIIISYHWFNAPGRHLAQEDSGQRDQDAR